MAAPKSGIPADGIAFDTAFTHVFELVCPNAAELNAAMSDAKYPYQSELKQKHSSERWEAAQRKADQWFRDQLAYDQSPDRLIAYQRFPDGDEQVDPRHWMNPPLIIGLADEKPPIFFRQDEFNRWLDRHRFQASPRRASGKQGKQPRIKIYLREKFADGVPDPAHCPRDALRADLLKWDKTLDPLDPKTLKAAIDEYNAEIASDRKR
ncbi:MAG TPA: hypothetical protein VLN57_07725 [Xanthobacteraceae bacterium]|nr:hypothetical protein [Xanthobacteraceae bacterium]